MISFYQRLEGMRGMIVSLLRHIRWHFSVGVLTVSLLPAFSHDTFETTAVARSSATNLEVQITMSQLAANKLLRQAGAADAALTMSDFDSVRPQLAEQAARLLEVFADGTALPLISSEVAPDDEGHVEFRLAYPPSSSQKLQLHTAFLRQLGKGYTCQLTLMDGAVGSIVTLKQRDEPVVEWAMKSRGEPMLESLPSELPPAKDSATGTRESAVAAGMLDTKPDIHDIKPVTQTSAATSSSFRWMLVAAIACVAGAVLWRLRKKKVRMTNQSIP